MSLLSLYWSVALTGILGTTLSVFLFGAVRNQVLLQHQARFAQRADAIEVAVRRTLRGYIVVLNDLGELFTVFPRLTRQQFRTFAHTEIARYPGIQALEWAPRVTAAERARYVAAARRDGFPTFQFTELSPDGKIVRAGRRPTYVPVYYVEPLAGNESALGFIPRIPTRDRAMETARMTGGPAATGQFKLIQGGNGIVVFVPVFRSGGQAHRMGPVRPVAGYVEGVFRVPAMFSAAVSSLDLHDVSYELVDESASPPARLLARCSAPCEGDQAEILRFSFADRLWSLALSPATPLSAFNWTPWAALAGGLALTILGCVYVLALLRQREAIGAKLETFFSNTTDAIFFKDRDGRYLFINLSGARYLGRTPEEVVGRTDVELIGPEQGLDLMEHDREAMQADEVRTFEETVTVSGEERTFLSLKGPFRMPGGQLAGMSGICRDITEFRKTVEELARRQLELREAEELDKLKTQFVNAVSHDLRTPITSILGFTELLAEGAAGPLSDTQRDYVSQIDRSTLRLQRLVNDLLDYARLEAGMFKLRKEEINLSLLLRELARIMQPQLDEARVELEVNLPDVPLFVTVDPIRVERAVINLLVNAIKYSPPDGHIVLRAGVEGTALCLEVRDQGPGIAQNQLAKLFKPFSQVEGGLKIGGTGLGLYIAKEVVEAHGGTIGVESQPGQGATFWFRIPLAETV